MSKKRILLIEDEVNLVETTTVRLEAAGYKVMAAHDGKEGMDKAKRENPDLIILDLMLPKMDGHKVCGLLKADKRYNKIPIIIFTAKGQEADMELGKALGADAYIMKMSEPQVLLTKIHELLKEEEARTV